MTISDARPVTGLWNDRSLPADVRARSLLAAMTPAEKARQLGSTWPGHDTAGDVAPMQETFRGAESFEEAIVDGLGHLTRVFGTAPVTPEDGRARLAALQERVVAANRFGIPESYGSTSPARSRHSAALAKSPVPQYTSNSLSNVWQ